MSHKDSLRLQRQSEAQGPSAKAKPCRVRLPTWQDSITRRGSTRSTIRGGLLERQTNHVARAPFQPQPADLESKSDCQPPFQPSALLEQSRETTPSRSKGPVGANDNDPLGWREDPRSWEKDPRARAGSSTSFPKQKDVLKRRAKLKPPRVQSSRPY